MNILLLVKNNNFKVIYYKTNTVKSLRIMGFRGLDNGSLFVRNSLKNKGIIYYVPTG
jgi:hypothetical protein